jgi:hypothetical protein
MKEGDKEENCRQPMHFLTDSIQFHNFNGYNKPILDAEK